PPGANRSRSTSPNLANPAMITIRAGFPPMQGRQARTIGDLRWGFAHIVWFAVCATRRTASRARTRRRGGSPSGEQAARRTAREAVPPLVAGRAARPRTMRPAPPVPRQQADPGYPVGDGVVTGVLALRAASCAVLTASMA